MATKMGMKRKTPKVGIKRKQIKLYPLDIMFSRYVRIKAEYKCEYCGKQYDSHSKGLHCSHFISRRYRNTRFDECNVSVACYGCHHLFHDFPSLHRDFFVKRIGTDGIEQLEILARSGQKPDLEQIKVSLEKKLKAIGG